MSLKSKFLNGFAWNLADKLINQLGVLAITLYISRLIGPESFGLIGMLMLFVALTESAINNGFAQALVQKSHAMNEKDASTIFYINLLWGVFIYALLYFSAPFIAQFYSQPLLVDLGRFIFLIVIINSLVVVSKAKLTIKVDFKSQTLANSIGTISASIVAVYLVQHDYSYWSFAWFLMIKAFITNIFLYYFSRWLPKLIFSQKSFNELFKFGSNLMLAGFVATLANNLYILLIGRYFSTKQVGFFSQANNLTMALGALLSSTLQGVTFPIMTSIKDDREKLIDIFKQLTSITMLVTLPLFIGFAAVADTFVELVLGQEWLTIVPYIIIFSIARVLFPVSAINMNMLNAIGRSDLFLRVDLIKIPIMVIGLLVGINFGTIGVVVSILITNIIAYFINTYYSYTLFNYGAIQQLMLAKKYILAAVLMYFSIQVVEINSLILELFLKVILGATTYLVCLLILKDAFFVKILQQILGKIKRI